MNSRRDFTLALVGGAATAISGCGGGGGGDQPAGNGQGTSPSATQDADAALISLPFTSDYLLTTNIQDAVLGVRLGVVNGAYAATDGLITVGTTQLDLEFGKNSQIAALKFNGVNLVTVDYQSIFTIIRNFDENGNFTNGLVSFRNSTGRLQSGILKTKEFVDASSLSDIVDIQDKYDLVISMRSQYAATKDVVSRLTSLFFRNAYAASPLDDLINSLQSSNSVSEVIANIFRLYPRETIGVAAVITLLVGCKLVVTCPLALFLAALFLIGVFVYKKPKSDGLSVMLEGSFRGDDSGVFSVQLASNGKLSGTGYSNELQGNFQISGTASSSGNLNLETSGTTGTGATFTGAAQGLRISGNWNNSSAREAGTFSGHYKTNISGPKLS
ncbi:hypothetical protein [Comamonas thiooxydans]|uniref:hypothetical protein n=1 Tax=Comamonas thiooxydans TaxID=363952 RepID=UPI000A54CDAB|nr:hypothetical protein [Comamonas thiooxydans]